MVNFKTENSCAVVTGGGDGMGLQIALALVSNGCSVCICDISQQRLDAAAAQLHASVTKEHAGNIIISTKIKMFIKYSKCWVSPYYHISNISHIKVFCKI